MLVGKSFSMDDPKDLTAKGKPSIDPGATYTFELGLEGDIFGHESFREHARGTYLNKHGKVGLQLTVGGREQVAGRGAEARRRAD